MIRNFWCRYLCPYGALLGLLSLVSPLSIRRNSELCIRCGHCSQACPSGIRVQDMLRVKSPDCMGCMQCVEACPIKNCLEPLLARRRRVPLFATAAGCVLILLAAYVLAQATGHWDNDLPPAMLKRLYMMAG